MLFNSRDERRSTLELNSVQPHVDFPPHIASPFGCTPAAICSLEVSSTSISPPTNSQVERRSTCKLNDVQGAASTSISPPTNSQGRVGRPAASATWLGRVGQTAALAYRQTESAAGRLGRLPPRSPPASAPGRLGTRPNRT